MKRLLCKARGHRWKVCPSDDDRCKTCGLFRLWPSGELAQLADDGLKIFGRQTSDHVPDEDAEGKETDDLFIPGPRTRPSSLADRARR